MCDNAGVDIVVSAGALAAIIVAVDVGDALTDVVMDNAVVVIDIDVDVAAVVGGVNAGVVDDGVDFVACVDFVVSCGVMLLLLLLML